MAHIQHIKLSGAIALIFLSQSPAFAAQVPVERGRIEGVVLQTGGTVPQPVVGARITVTKVNGVTGANLPIRGGTPSPSIGGLNFGNVPFPGMPGIQIFQADGQPRPVVPPSPAPPQATLPIPLVTTDGDGRFVVPDLEEGAYRLLITQSGYVRQEFGQRVFPGQGALINVAAGQVFRDITIHLTPTGNVGGRLVDNNGQPAVGVNLQLLKTIYNVNGQRIFQSAGNARTNDSGEYRFFWVTPGRYYVAGGSAAASFTFGGGTGPNDPGDGYVLTYYPGVTDINRATPVDVKSGSELAVDFVTSKQRLYTISGKVVSTGAAAGVNGQISGVTLSLAFRLLTGNPGAFTMMEAYDPATGTFVMRNVLPGSYVLQAAAPPSYARMPVEIENHDVEGLVVAVDRGVNINGRFVVENGNVPPLNIPVVQLRLMTNELPNYAGAMPNSSPVAADGSFTISSVFQGQYRVVAPSSQDFYVKELRYDRADALNSPIDVYRRNSDSETMEVVLSRKVGQIDGIIVDDRGQPVSGVQAVLIPDNRGRTDLYKTTTTDQGGRFMMRGIAPGDYKLFAWEAMENYGYFDPEVMRRSDILGKALRVAESSRLSVEAKVIPAAQ